MDEFTRVPPVAFESPSATPVVAGGNITLHAWDFTYTSSGLVVGIPIYVPTVGDILMDGWVEIQTFWTGGLNAFMDVFSDATGSFGIFSNGNAPVNLKTGNHGGSPDYTDGNVRYAYAVGHTSILSGEVYPHILTTDPLNLFVTTSGVRSGADPGSTAGAATLYLAIASPGARGILV